MFALLTTKVHYQRNKQTAIVVNGAKKVKMIYYLNPINPGPEVINLFSRSTQLSTKFQLLVETKIPIYEEVSCFKSLRCCIYHADKCENASNCLHFNIYEHVIFIILINVKIPTIVGILTFISRINFELSNCS